MDKETIQELEKLFTLTSASSIRKSIQVALFSYLVHNKEGFPRNYERTIEDFYFLINFLEKAERYTKSNQ